jgi:DNA-binding beta-propeller fold protein YncE
MIRSDKMIRWARVTALALLPALCLLSAGCSKSSSSSSSTTATVVVTPAASLISVNGTQTFSAAVTNVATIAIAATNGAVRASNAVTITTTAAHNLAAGETVSITGVTDATFDGTFTVNAVPSSTTFTYTQAGVDATSGAGAITNDAVNWSVNGVAGGNTSVGTITSGGVYTAPASLPKATTASITASGAVRSATTGTVTITTSAAHNLVIGQVIVISGVTDSTFNGTFQVVSVPSTTTFTYTQTGNTSTSGNGTVTSFAVTITATSVVSTSSTGTAVASIDSGIGITITPTTATVGTGETFQFNATVAGVSGSNQGVTWQVNGVTLGAASTGTISSSGLFTAPATAPTSNTATIVGTNGAVRNTNVVTITTAAAHGFATGQSVTIAGVSDTTFNGTFAIASVPSITTFTYAQTAANATSGGGTAVSTSDAVTITAISVADPTRSTTAGALIVTATDPTLTSVTPSVVAEGAVFQDVYLVGTNMISTTIVKVNGVALPLANIFQATSTVLRARLTANMLTTAGTLAIDLERLNGTATPTVNVTVVPVRPAFVGATPDSGVQGGPAFSFNVNGGFFGPSTSPIITGEFAGNLRSIAVNPANDTRQASLTVGPSDLATAGLFEVGVRSATNPALFAATNLAVRPTGAASIIGTPIMVGTQPDAIAINQVTGIAVVANRCSNSINRIDVTTNPPSLSGSAITVGANPTGVAVDDIRNLAIVANSGNNTGCTGAAGTPNLSIVNLATGTVTATITPPSGAVPNSVGVNPLTGLALVAYQSTNHADIVDLTLTPPAIVSSVTISTGANPQIAVNPKLNWAVVTPGGAGTVSIVDLSRRASSTIAASSGVSRANGITTVTTTAAHPFLQSEVVLISGVADNSFNGVFVVNSVTSTTTFTYAQAGASNASSGGGTAATTPPVAVAGLGLATRGIAVNTYTQQALLVDPSSANLTFMGLFDQVTSNVTLSEIGAVAAAFSPFTNIAVTVNSTTNQASIIDPLALTRLAMINVGAGPSAVAIDAGTNTAFVVNTTDGTVTAIALGSIRSLHVSALSLPAANQLAPGVALTSAAPVSMTLLGHGFVSGSVVRLNDVALPPPSSISANGRQLTVSIPASFLSGASIYVLDVLNPGSIQSNVLNLIVAQPVNLVGAGGSACTAPAPTGVAIDPQRNLAVVANTGCNNVAIVDLNPATLGNILNTVATDAGPYGVAISPSRGFAIVSNNGASDVAIIDLTVSPPVVKTTVTVGTGPRGVAVNEAAAQALVANAGGVSLSIIDLIAQVVASTVTLDRFPEAVAVDPVRNVAAVADGGANELALVSLNSLTITNRINVALPTAVVFDPVSTNFIVNGSLGNNLEVVNPDTGQSIPVRIGINPTSMAYSFAASTFVTVNSASGTFTILDTIDLKIRDVFEIPGSPQFAVDIHPRTNLAVVVDQTNNRLLLFPLPK